ncbi:unnamed protein product [Rotaria magnacalcarata]
MIFNNRILFLLLVFLNLIIAEHYSAAVHNHDNIILISSVIGRQLTFDVEGIKEFIDDENFETIVWYKGITDLKPLISNSESSINSYDLPVEYNVSNRSRYSLVNQTILAIEQTSIDDEGFYTLKIISELNDHKQYIYHVVLFIQNLSLFLTPPSFQQVNYRAEQSINLTCSISLYADPNYIKQAGSLFSSMWYMIIYNNDADHYQLRSSTSVSYSYTAYLVNYELNKNDHNQTVLCTLIQQNLKPTVLLNATLPAVLNIQYKTYLYGNYYFTRSFNSYSSIEINCEEFDGNPKPMYTLIWMLNGENRTLLNKTQHGKYIIDSATWRNRGKDSYYHE